MPSNVRATPPTPTPRCLPRDTLACDNLEMGTVTLSVSGSTEGELTDENRMLGEQGR
jgi:hypothetical protein